MPWQKTLIIIVACVSIIALVITSIVTGRDAPVTLAGLLGSILGLALGADAFIVIRNPREGSDNRDRRR